MSETEQVCWSQLRLSESLSGSEHHHWHHYHYNQAGPAGEGSVRVPPPCDITIQETPLFLLPPPPTSLLCHPHTWLFLTFLTLAVWWADPPTPAPSHPAASSVYSLHLWAVLTTSLTRISPHFPLTFLPKVCISAGMTGTALPFLPPLPLSLL